MGLKVHARTGVQHDTVADAWWSVLTPAEITSLCLLLAQWRCPLPTDLGTSFVSTYFTQLDYAQSVSQTFVKTNAYITSPDAVSRKACRRTLQMAKKLDRLIASNHIKINNLYWNGFNGIFDAHPEPGNVTCVDLSNNPFSEEKSMLTKKRIATALVCALVLGASGAALATPITFTFTTTNATGSLNGNAMSGDFTLTLKADTANLIDCSGEPAYGGCNFFQSPPLSGLTATFTFGSASGTFTDPFIFYKGGADAEVGPSSRFAQIHWFCVPGFPNYDMVSAFGPSNSTCDNETTFLMGDGTSAGTLDVQSSVNPQSVFTFDAALGGPGGGAIGVPEPGELPLFGFGLLSLLGLVAVRRRGGSPSSQLPAGGGTVAPD